MEFDLLFDTDATVQRVRTRSDGTLTPLDPALAGGDAEPSVEVGDARLRLAGLV